MPVVMRWVKGTGRVAHVRVEGGLGVLGHRRLERQPSSRMEIQTLGDRVGRGPGGLLAPFTGARFEDVGLGHGEVGLSLEEARQKGSSISLR
jgi:hypothetical protein